MSIETMHTLRKAPVTSPLYREFSVVALVAAVSTDDGNDVPAGAHGTIVSVYGDGAAYEVEFAHPIVGNATVRTELLRAA